MLLSASLIVIFVSFMITITQGAEQEGKFDEVVVTCTDGQSSESAKSGSLDTNCQGTLSTPEFLTILMVGLGLAGIGFTVRRLSNGSTPH